MQLQRDARAEQLKNAGEEVARLKCVLMVMYVI